VLPFNDIEAVESRVKNGDLAAIVVEPVLGAGGCVPARQDFLRELRELCSEKRILLIFDEVITGFRLSPGGAQQYYGVLPDITVLGKILGGGFPAGAVASSSEIMEHMDALRYEKPNLSFHGGTFCANPVTMTAGLATLRRLEDGRLLNELNKRGDHVRQHLSEIFGRRGVDVQVTGVGSLFHTHFTREEIKDVHGVFRADRGRMLEYHIYLMTKGIFFLPTKTGALSTAHTSDDIDSLLTAAKSYVEDT
jgi:glutamate-1-semialdehyde 2,1-aminomutase